MATVMIAEDDPTIVEVVSMILEIGGYEVATASDGDTLNRIIQKRPDLLLLDIWMSGEDGREVCKCLKQDKTTKRIPIIMISASRDLEKSAKESGADDFLAKPFDMDELLKKIGSFIPG